MGLTRCYKTKVFLHLYFQFFYSILKIYSIAQNQFQQCETKGGHVPIITPRRSFAEYWKHFVARFNNVHASGYNSAGSERISMKFGALRVYCLELALTDFGRDPCRSKSGRPSWNFVFFCAVNNARLYSFQVSQIPRNLHTRHGSAKLYYNHSPI